MEEIIKGYILDSKNSYICPGKKQNLIRKSLNETGSMTEEVIQKRLLLYTLRDLYSNFLQDYSGNEKIPKLSHFASLVPEEVIYAGDAGSHNICVCVDHENMKLKLFALNKSINYRDLIAAAVCDSDDIDCMLHRCDKCPGIPGITEALEDFDIFWDRREIRYKLWDTKQDTRASLITMYEGTETFKENLIKGIWNLTSHHFIAQTQKNYLHASKDELESDTCIVLMDFSENYSFVIQNSIQAFFYNNNQATIHPFVMYFKNPGDNNLQEKSFCIISNTKDHWAYAVHAFQDELLKIIKVEYPWIEKIRYFSDGAPTQYKNK